MSYIHVHVHGYGAHAHSTSCSRLNRCTAATRPAASAELVQSAHLCWMVAAAATHKHEAPAPLLCLLSCDPHHRHRHHCSTASAASAAVAMAAAFDNDEESFRSATAPSRTPSRCVPAAAPPRGVPDCCCRWSVGSRLACASLATAAVRFACLVFFCPLKTKNRPRPLFDRANPTLVCFLTSARLMVCGAAECDIVSYSMAILGRLYRIAIRFPCLPRSFASARKRGTSLPRSIASRRAQARHFLASLIVIVPT